MSFFAFERNVFNSFSTKNQFSTEKRRHCKTSVLQHPLEVREFDSGEDLIASYDQNYTFDIIFLDVKMKELSGIETVKELRRRDKNVIVIFISGFVQFITEILRYNVFQFLIKPVSDPSFTREFQRAINRYYETHSQYKIVQRDRITIFTIKEILYVETLNRHLILHTVAGDLQYNGKIRNEYAKLRTHGFIQVHQAFIVNMSFIKTIDTNEIVLKDSSTIPISKRLRKDVVIQFNLFVSRYCL